MSLSFGHSYLTNTSTSSLRPSPTLSGTSSPASISPSAKTQNPKITASIATKTQSHGQSRVHHRRESEPMILSPTRIWNSMRSHTVKKARKSRATFLRFKHQGKRHQNQFPRWNRRKVRQNKHLMDSFKIKNQLNKTIARRGAIRKCTFASSKTWKHLPRIGLSPIVLSPRAGCDHHWILRRRIRPNPSFLLLLWKCRWLSWNTLMLWQCLRSKSCSRIPTEMELCSARLSKSKWAWNALPAGSQEALTIAAIISLPQSKLLRIIVNLWRLTTNTLLKI